MKKFATEYKALQQAAVKDMSDNFTDLVSDMEPIKNLKDVQERVKENCKYFSKQAQVVSNFYQSVFLAAFGVSSSE